MSRTSALHQLQQIDLGLDQHHQRLAEIAQLLGESQAVQQAQAALAAAQAQLDEINRAIKRLDNEAHDTRQKRKSAEQRLYGGNVKNPKELEDLQQKIASLNKYAATLDDRQLDAMIELEDAQTALQEATRQLQQLTGEWQTTQADLKAEEQTRQTEVAALRARQQTARQHATPADLPTYDKLRQTKHGRPVATLSPDGICGACGISIPTAQRQQARNATELTLCPNCGRIWHVE